MALRSFTNMEVKALSLSVFKESPGMSLAKQIEPSEKHPQNANDIFTKRGPFFFMDFIFFPFAKSRLS